MGVFEYVQVVVVMLVDVGFWQEVVFGVFVWEVQCFYQCGVVYVIGGVVQWIGMFECGVYLVDVLVFDDGQLVLKYVVLMYVDEQFVWGEVGVECVFVYFEFVGGIELVCQQCLLGIVVFVYIGSMQFVQYCIQVIVGGDYYVGLVWGDWCVGKVVLVVLELGIYCCQYQVVQQQYCQYGQIFLFCICYVYFVLLFSVWYWLVVGILLDSILWFSFVVLVYVVGYVFWYGFCLVF